MDTISYTKAKKAQQLAQQIIDGEFDTGALNTNIEQRLNNLEVEYSPRLSAAESQLASSAKQINPYSYTDYGIAFDSNDPTLVEYDTHASWAHSNVSYDETDDKVVVFYDIKPAHVITGNRVLMRKKDVEGGFSAPFIVADRISEGISCKSQASGIAKNGDYISLVAHINNSTGAVIGTWVYRSVDKGQTWANTEMLCGGNPVKAHSGDVTGFLVLESGRILTLACVDGTRLMTIMYSNDHGVTWNFATVPTEYNHTEPAWCELSDGTIIAYLRADVTMDFSTKVPARFTKSLDGGLTWLASAPSTSILDYTNSNGHLIFHKESKTVEFIHHSRYTQPDGFGSLYVSVASEENAKNDMMGEQIRISKLSPQDKNVDTTVGSYTGDSGYVGACKSKSGVITVFYYNGNTKNSQICYLVGKKTAESSKVFEIDYYTGKTVNPKPNLLPLSQDYWEQGGLNGSVGGQDTLSASTIRLRLKNFLKIQGDKTYIVACDNTTYKIAIRQYDSNFNLLSDSGWKTDYAFTTFSETIYIKTLIAHNGDTTIVVPELYSDLFVLEKITFTLTTDPFSGNVIIPQPNLLPWLPKRWEQGSLSVNLGGQETLTASTIRLRLKDFLPVQADKTYQVKCMNKDYSIVIRQYDSSNNLLSDSGWKTDFVFTTFTNTVYAKAMIRKNNDTTITVSELYSNLFILERSAIAKEKLYLYNNGNEREFFTGLFGEILKINTGLSAKNTNNIELSITNSTSGIDSISRIAQSSINISGYSKLKANVNVTGIVGMGRASMRLYNKINPTDGGDGRLALTETTVNGKQTLTIDLAGLSGNIYPAMFANATAATGSVNAKFYEMWLE